MFVFNRELSLSGNVGVCGGCLFLTGSCLFQGMLVFVVDEVDVCF